MTSEQRNDTRVAHPDLLEPLLLESSHHLPSSEANNSDDNQSWPRRQQQSRRKQNGSKRGVPMASPDEDGLPTSSDHDPQDAIAAAATTNTTSSFSLQNEIVEMLHLALPLAVSFFCRMGMASTDR